MGVGGVGAGSVLIMNEFYVSIFSVVGDGVLHIPHPFSSDSVLDLSALSSCSR